MKNIVKIGFINRLCIFTVLVMGVITNGCGTKTEKKKIAKKQIEKQVPKLEPMVEQPFSKVNLPYQEIMIDADSGKTFIVDNNYGSSVTIPRKVFIDSVGKLVSGKVSIRYREMHTINDMLICGAPLSYDAAGMLKRFNSGGMFEIRAFQNNKPVFLDSGKVIIVHLSSFQTNDNYHAFYLDEIKNRNWVYLKDLNGEENPEKKKIIRKARQKVKEFKVPFDGNYFAFNYMALLDVYLNDKAVEIKKNRNDLTLQGKIKEYGVTWTSIYCYQPIEFNGTKTLASLLLWKKLNKEAWPVWANTATCNIVANTNGTFTLELTPPKSKVVYKATIQPFFPIKSLLAFSPSYWRNKYNIALGKVIEEEMRKQKLADVFQTLEVHAFGFYNIDKLQREEDYVQVNLKPEFEGEISAINDMDIYYISEEFRTVIKYPREQWANITLLPDGNGKLFTVLPGNKIAIAEEEALKKISYQEFRDHPGTVLPLKFRTINLPVNTIGAIAKALGIQEFPV